MDFLDPKKQRAQLIRLIVGYVLIGVAVLFATVILLYQAYGFGVQRDGEVVQKGLVFLSSDPNPANIYVDGKLYRSATNTKWQPIAGSYKVELRREGYRNWQRLIQVEGGNVLHVDYPKLFPTNLTTSVVKAYPEAPGFATQSPDRRWIVVQQESSPLGFDLYDVADPTKIAAATTSFGLPESVITTSRVSTHSYKLVEWSTDNRHILVVHNFVTEAGTVAGEYILVDRSAPEESVNLTKAIDIGTDRLLTLRDKKFDKYYVYDPASKILNSTTLNEAGKLTTVLDQVLSYKTYANNIVLYMTGKDITTGKPYPDGKVASVLLDNGQNYLIREHGVAGPYLLELAQYKNDWFVTVGASGDNKVYVYKNPQQTRRSSTSSVLVPVRILRINAPNYVAFSSNTEFVMTSNGTTFADYDAETDKGYTFTSKLPLDQPQNHGSWMDGHRLFYVSGGKVVVFDYDNINGQTLVPASPNYTPFLDRNFTTLYTLTPGTGGTGMNLTLTRLLTPADQ